MTVRLTVLCCAATASVRELAFPTDDEPLDARGEEELRAVRGDIASSAQAVTSPLRRSLDTARGFGLQPAVAAELRDCDHGRWTGRAFLDIQKREPDALAVWMRDPHAAPHGGESVAALVRRATDWLAACAKNGRLVAVTHPALVRAMLLSVLDVPLAAYYRIDVPPLSATELTFDGRRWMLRARALSSCPPNPHP